MSASINESNMNSDFTLAIKIELLIITDTTNKKLSKNIFFLEIDRKHQLIAIDRIIDKITNNIYTFSSNFTFS